MLVKRK